MDDAVVHDLKEEILYLHSLLDANGIKYDFEAYCLEKDARKAESPMIPIDITPETAKFFFSMFHGRVDVYAKRYSKGYYTVCDNRNKYGMCPKKAGKKTKCPDFITFSSLL